MDKLEKKYTVITNDGTEMYVIGMGSREINQRRCKVFGDDGWVFYRLTGISSKWDSERTGCHDDMLYALTPEDFHKFNNYEEPVTEMTMAELEETLGKKIKIIK